MPDDANELIGLVKSIEVTLDIVRGKNRDIGMTLLYADLELLLGAKQSLTVGGQVPLVPIDISFDGAWTNVQTFNLRLTASGSAGDLSGVDVTDHLAQGILALASAVKQTNSLHHKSWSVSNPKVTVNVEREQSGTLKIGGGGGKASRRTHTIALTFMLS